MRRFFIWLVILVWLVPSYGMAKGLTVITENNPPYTFEKDGRVSGITTDILLEVMREAGLQLSCKDIQLWPWARGYETIQNESNVLLYATSWSAERESMFQWVGPIMEARHSVLALKDTDITIEEPKTDLTKYRIGTVRKAVAERSLETQGVKLGRVHRLNDVELGLDMMLEGRLDGVVFNDFAMRSILAEKGVYADKVKTVYIVMKTQHFFALSKDTDPALVKQLQDALDRLKVNGTVDSIIKQYIH